MSLKSQSTVSLKQASQRTPHPNHYQMMGWIMKGRCLVGSDTALEALARQSITCGPKEALAILNGTAVSTAVAALAVHEAHYLAILWLLQTSFRYRASHLSIICIGFSCRTGECWLLNQSGVSALQFR